MSKLRLLGHSLWYALAVSLVILAVTFSATRLGLGMVRDYRIELQSWVSERLGAEVKIGKLGASLRGFQPEVRLQQIVIQQTDPDVPPLQVQEIRVGINVSQLLTGELWPDYLSIVGTRLVIHRLADGRISVAGLSTSNPDENRAAGNSMGWLMRPGEFEILDSEITWIDQTRDVPALKLAHTSIRIVNESDRHRVALRTRLPDDMGRSLRVHFDLNGDLAQASGWGGDVYLEGNGIDLAALMQRLPKTDWVAEEGLASVRLWSEWEAARPVRLQGQVTLGSGLVRSADHPGEIDLSKLEAWFDWHQQTSGWQLQVYDFSMASGSWSSQDNRFSVRWDRPAKPEDQAGQHAQMVLVADQVDVGLWSHLVQRAGLLETAHQQQLQAHALSGRLQHLQLAYMQQDEGIRWSLCTGFAELSAQAWERWPGLKGIDGQTCLSDAAGWVELNSQQAELNVPRLFRDPFKLKRLQGYVTAERESEHWRLDLQRVEAANEDIETVSRATLLFPMEGGKPFMELQTDFANGVATAVPRYLPAGILGPKTLAWLDQAFLDGHVPSGSFVYRGDTAGFPYRDHSGRFQVLFDVAGAELHYAPGWPNLKSVSGEVEFKNEGLFIRGHQGQISGNQIQSAFVTIPDLHYSEHLAIQGTVEDDVSGLYRFFRDSPIRDRIQALLDESEIDGPGEVSLKLKVPLRHGGDYDVAAEAKVKQARIRFPAWNLQVNQVHGALQFDALGLHAKSLQGTVMNQAVQAEIQSNAESTIVQAQASMPVSELAKHYPSDFWRHVRGASPVALKVHLPKSGMGEKAQAELALSSSLQGVQIRMPEPLGKSEKSNRPLQLKLSLGHGASLPIQASYGEQLHAKLRLRGEPKVALERADFRLGGQAAELPQEPGVRLSGQMETLDADRWLDWLHTSSAKDAKGSAAPSVNQIDLRAGQLRWSGRDFEAVHFAGKHRDAAWRGELTSPLIQGGVVLPDEVSPERPISLQLSRLQLPKGLSDDTETGTETDQPSESMDPSKLPALDLKSTHFFVDDADLGALTVSLRPRPKGLSIEKLSIQSKRDQLDATGSWIRQASADKTVFKGTLKSASFGALLDDLGFTSQLKQTDANIEFDLNWPAAPQSYANRVLNGSLHLRTGKGRLLDLEPGVGRVFGLLSLGTIQRRLQLDFSDLLQKGMSFDKIRGHYQIEQGQAVTSDFYLEGPAARLDIQGRIGLGERDYDQIVTVTPKTTSSLPVAGAIAGGPVVGAAVFLAQKLVGKNVEAITRYQYQVTGSWDDPQIQQIKSPTGGILNKVIDSVTPDALKAAPK